jgi:hypothetical protein
MIGENPQYIDFSAPDARPNISAEKILAGLNGARDRLAGAGYEPQILVTKDETTVEDQMSVALQNKTYDVIVVGAGLRTLPRMAAQFERLMNVLHEKAPRAKLAFNTKPDDSDAAALRWL